jgi:hypothetical protein
MQVGKRSPSAGRVASFSFLFCDKIKFKKSPTALRGAWAPDADPDPTPIPKESATLASDATAWLANHKTTATNKESQLLLGVPDGDGFPRPSHAGKHGPSPARAPLRSTPSSFSSFTVTTAGVMQASSFSTKGLFG